MKYWMYSEPYYYADDNWINRDTVMEESDIIKMMRGINPIYNNNNVSDKDVLYDFIAVHWATELKNYRDNWL